MPPKDLTTFRLESMEKSIEEIKINLKEHTLKEEQDRMVRDSRDDDRHKEIMAKFDQLNTKYAWKWIEKAFIWWAGIVWTWLITALLKLLIK